MTILIWSILLFLIQKLKIFEWMLNLIVILDEMLISKTLR